MSDKRYRVEWTTLGHGDDLPCDPENILRAEPGPGGGQLTVWYYVGQKKVVIG